MVSKFIADNQRFGWYISRERNTVYFQIGMNTVIWILNGAFVIFMI